MRDKALLRMVTRAAGIPNPESESVDTPEQVRRFLAEHGGPVILKPANRQAAVGTRILHEAGEVDPAWTECVAQDEGVMVPDRAIPLRMLVERCVPGHEYSVEMVVRDGVPLFANVTDKLLYPGPRPVELGHMVPAEISPELEALLRERTTAVLRAVGFGTGIVHCEWIVDGPTPYLVECAGRFPGDGIVELIERAYAMPVGQHYFTVMRGGEPPSMEVPAAQAAAVRFAQVPPGEVVSVAGLDAARAIPGVVGASVTVAAGGTVHELRSSWDRVGSAMACAPTPGEAMRLAEKAIEQVHIVTRGTQWNSR
jgi:biotin carboxylase